MIEIVGGVMLHPEFFHYSPRPRIGWHRECHNFPQVKLLKAVFGCSPCSFRGEALPPIVRVQAPSYLDARGEWRVERRNI